jgi:hypothetical protein
MKQAASKVSEMGDFTEAEKTLAVNPLVPIGSVKEQR